MLWFWVSYSILAVATSPVVFKLTLRNEGYSWDEAKEFDAAPLFGMVLLSCAIWPVIILLSSIFKPVVATPVAGSGEPSGSYEI